MTLLTFYLALLGGAIVVLVVHAFAYPAPLPRATIGRDGAPTARGDLVVHGNGGWVLATGDRRLTVVHDDDVTGVAIEQRQRHLRTTFEVLFGRRIPLVG